MSKLDSLLPASFRGASFLMYGHSTNGGRKTVTHEYPNSDRRFVEDLGKLEKRISISAVVSGRNFATLRDALIAAMEAPGAGLLMHPTLGSKNVAAVGYTLSEDDTEVGIAKFDLQFEVTETSIFPTVGANNAPKISSLFDDIGTNALTNFTDFYSVSALFTGNYEAALRQALDFSDVFQGFINSIGFDVGDISSIAALVLNFKDDIPEIVTNPTTFGTRVVQLYSSVRELDVPAATILKNSSELASFGSEYEQFEPVTAGLRERLSTQNAIVTSVNSLTYGLTSEAATGIDYQTNADLSVVENTQENHFQSFSELPMNNDLLQSIKDTRTELRTFFDAQEVALPKLITVNTQPIPAAVLNYAYYGDLKNEETIINLNNNLRPERIAGDVTILTQPTT